MSQVDFSGAVRLCKIDNIKKNSQNLDLGVVTGAALIQERRKQFGSPEPRPREAALFESESRKNVESK